MSMHPDPECSHSSASLWTRPLAVGALLGATLFAAGCRNDIKDFADRHVQTDMLDQHEKREAITFLENKGQFFDLDSNTHVDREVVLPLLKRLKELAPTEQWAMLRPEDKHSAYGMLIALPAESKIVDEMADAVQEADDKFSGCILQQWGHRWLLINLIDQQTLEYLKQANPDLENQR